MIAAIAPLLLLSAAQEIVCPGSYGGHVQGIDTDDQHNIYWSFTVALIKTGDQGEILAEADVVAHHGDVTWLDSLLYVAVNLGKFNREAGEADSWVYIYDDENLEFIERHPVPEVVHGAGGMTFHDGTFVVIGGLPKGHDRNYVYLYDEDFTFIARRDVLSGYTNMGIQTACFLNGEYWFGTYNGTDSLIHTDADFGIIGRYEPNGSYGLAAWKEGQWLRAVSAKGDEPKTWKATAVVEPIYKP